MRPDLLKGSTSRAKLWTGHWHSGACWAEMSLRKPCSAEWILATVFLVFLLGMVMLYVRGGRSCNTPAPRGSFFKPLPRPSQRINPIGASQPRAAAPAAAAAAAAAPAAAAAAPAAAAVAPAGVPADRTASLPIVAETFLYMTMGAGQPNPFVVARSCLPKSALIYMTFKTAIKLEKKANCNSSTLHVPATTWTSGRNELLRQAKLLEISLGWRYEFFIFTDSDVNLVSNIPTEKNADIFFQSLLLQHRPLRASVPYGDIPVAPVDKKIHTCAQITFTDSCVDAYHRTGVDLLLPYVPVLDLISWPMSAYISNLIMAAIAPGYGHMYRQIGIEFKFTTHTKYPKNHGVFDTGRGWVMARKFVNFHLEINKVPGFNTREPLGPKLKAALFGTGPNGANESCQAQAKGVDYETLIPYRVL